MELISSLLLLLLIAGGPCRIICATIGSRKGAAKVLFYFAYAIFFLSSVNCTKSKNDFPVECEAHGEWFTHWGRYLVITGELKNTSSEVFENLRWSSEMDIVLDDGRILHHSGHPDATSILKLFELEPLSETVNKIVSSIIQNPLVPRASANFKINGILWGSTLRVSQAEMAYPIRYVHLIVRGEIHTPTNRTFKGKLIDAIIPPPYFRKKFPLQDSKPAQPSAQS